MSQIGSLSTLVYQMPYVDVGGEIMSISVKDLCGSMIKIIYNPKFIPEIQL